MRYAIHATVGWGFCLWVGLVGAQQAQQAQQVQPEVTRLPLVIAGKPVETVTHLYKPFGSGPFPLVIFSHGRAGSQVERAKLQYPVLVGHANYWLRQGVAVLAPVRPGYGDTGGTDREDPHSNWRNGVCSGNPDFTTTSQAARETVVAAYQWALQQPWVRKDRILLEGQSVGGMTTVAAAALNLPGVVGVVNFAGGSGGYPEASPGRSCKPENLAETYRAYGREAKAPSLWLYAENDLYWGPEAPRTWHEAFKAGGSDSTFVQTGPVEGRDGHQLLNYGGAMWRGPLDAFVRKVGLLTP